MNPPRFVPGSTLFWKVFKTEAALSLLGTYSVPLTRTEPSIILKREMLRRVNPLKKAIKDYRNAIVLTTNKLICPLKRILNPTF